MYIVFNSTSFYTYILHTYIAPKKINFIFLYDMQKIIKFFSLPKNDLQLQFLSVHLHIFLMFSLKKNKYSKLFAATIIFFLLQNSSINHFSTFFSEKKNYFLKSILKINSELKGLYVIGRNLRYIRRPLKLFYLNLPFFCVFFGKSRIWNMGLKSGKKCNCSS